MRAGVAHRSRAELLRGEEVVSCLIYAKRPLPSGGRCVQVRSEDLADRTLIILSELEAVLPWLMVGSPLES